MAVFNCKVWSGSFKGACHLWLWQTCPDILSKSWPSGGAMAGKMEFMNNLCSLPWQSHVCTLLYVRLNVDLEAFSADWMMGTFSVFLFLLIGISLTLGHFPSSSPSKSVFHSQVFLCQSFLIAHAQYGGLSDLWMWHGTHSALRVKYLRRCSLRLCVLFLQARLSSDPFEFSVFCFVF